MHVLSSILAVPPSVEIAPDGHSSTQIPHPVHISLFTHGTCLSPLHSSHRNRGPPMTPAARTLPSQLGAASIASSHHLVPLPATVTPERLQRNTRLAPNAPRLAGSLPSMSAVLPTERLLGCFVSALPKRVSCPPSGFEWVPSRRQKWYSPAVAKVPPAGSPSSPLDRGPLGYFLWSNLPCDDLACA